MLAPNPSKEQHRIRSLQYAQPTSPTMNDLDTDLDLFCGGPHTPGQKFSFADFCNITPDPAHWIV